MRGPAVFLDKDGTILEDVAYNVDPGRMRLLPGAAEGLRRLREAGYRLIVVSNQAGVARGLITESQLQTVECGLRGMLERLGLALAGFYYCPHHPDGSVRRYAIDCGCRKPAAGLIEKAARRHNVDLAGSWMIGDILDDVEAGKRAGCRTVLIVPGGETVWRRSPLRTPDLVARDLSEAAHLVSARRDLSKRKARCL